MSNRVSGRCVRTFHVSPDGERLPTRPPQAFFLGGEAVRPV